MSNLYSDEIFAAGDTGYAIYCDMVVPVTVVEIRQPSESSEHSLLDVKMGSPLYGSVALSSDNVFHRQEDANAARYARSRKFVELYRESMSTPKDLVRFALTHTLCGEYADAEAREAFIDCAKSLGLYDGMD